MINGNWSLKTMDEQPQPKNQGAGTVDDEGKNGCVVRSLPHTLRLAPETTYRLSFEYRVDNPDQYRVVVRSDQDDTPVLDHVLSPDCTRFEGQFATGPREDCHIAIMKDDNARGMLLLDDLAVDPA